MGISVRLDLKTKSVLERLARLRRSTRSQVIREALHALLREEVSASGGLRPIDAMRPRIGCGLGRDGHLAEEAGRKLAEVLAQRKTRRRR